MAATSFKPRAFSTIIEMLVNVFIFIFLYASLSEPDSFFCWWKMWSILTNYHW